MTVAAIVPIKTKSRRLPNKNFLMLGGRPLVHHVLETLLEASRVDAVYAYCRDPNLVKLLPDGVSWLPRNPRLDGDDVKANELFLDSVRQVSHDIVALCQAPSPFTKVTTVERCVQLVEDRACDVAVTVRRHQHYAWFEGEPLNYRAAEIVQTQMIKPVLTETSGVYAFRRDGYLNSGSRIHGVVKHVEVDHAEALDIDEPEDFALAQVLVESSGAARPRSGEFTVRLLDLLGSEPGFAHVAFDLDGVLVDSLEVMEEAWTRACDAVGINIPFDLYRNEIGKPFDAILATLGVESCLKSELRAVFEKVSTERSSDVQQYPGAVECLEALRSTGLRTSIVTSKSRHRAAHLVEARFGGLVDALVTPEDLPEGRGKPNPDSILRACLDVQRGPKDTLYVGDMPTDRDAAAAAGVTYVHAGWGYGGLDAVAVPWFARLEDLTGWLVR